MGRGARGFGEGIFRAKAHNQVGTLQPPQGLGGLQSGAGEKAEGFTGICRSAWAVSSAGAEAEQAIL